MLIFMFFAGLAQQAGEAIEVAVSSSQIVGAIGASFLLLLSLLGWALNYRLKGIDVRLEKIERKVDPVPALEARVINLENRTNIVSKRQEKVANFVNRLAGRLEKGKIEVLDLNGED